MPTGDGKFIEPTGKAYEVSMATIGHWKGGVMNEEYLFWDKQELMKQSYAPPLQAACTDCRACTGFCVSA